METQINATPAPMADQSCVPQKSKMPNDWEFDIGRAYMLLTFTLVLPIYLSLSIITFSLGGLVI
ncbi:MAG: hypothetical protein WCX71_04680 [Candidatus Buchananbacteria bacterium]